MKSLKLFTIPLVLLACSLFSPGTESEAIPPPSPTAKAAEPTLVPSPTPTEGPRYKDLTIRPQIWFGPLDPWSWDQYFPGSGPFQYYDLFQPSAPWQNASDAVQVIRLYPVWLESYASPEQIKAVLDDIHQRGMAISYEAGPLTETPLCNAATVEGFWGVPAAEKIASRISAAGGTLYSMDLEHAFDAGTYYDPNCFMTPSEIASDAAKAIAAVRTVFPNIRIGSIETADLDPEAVATWLQAYRNVMGTELDYFHLDTNFSRPDWAVRALEIQQVVNRRGIEFGIIYFGEYNDSSDPDWLAHAESRFVEYEVLTGGRPDHVIFQSWHTHPQSLLPENEPGTFTNLILRYLRPRTSLELEQIDDLTLAGRLTTESGSPVPGVQVQILARSVSGEGLLAEYTITGTVPAGATTADAGFRVNMECDCSGPAEFVLEEINYTELGSTGNGVPNGSFGSGLNGWGTWGTGSLTLVSSLNGTGSALAVTASVSQDAGLNSDLIQITAGSAFTITFTARVAPLTQGSGYFDIIFLNNEGEVARMTVPIKAGDVTLSKPVTGPDGRFEVNLQQLPAGEVSVRGWYPGSDEYWPAQSEPAE